MSGSSLRKAFALLPFGYSMATRVDSWRDIAFLVASMWIPGTWLLIRLAGLPPVDAAATYLLGYLAFVALYEVGYFVNDAWDAAKSPEGRQRLRFGHGTGFIAVFLLLHVGTWAAIGYWQGWLYDPVWLAGFAALALVFAEHNLLDRPALRLSSFYQLATLRFVLPVIALIPSARYFETFVAIALLYTYLRYLSYADSKDLLRLPERRRPAFGLLHILLVAPLTLFAALLAGSTLLVELLAYFGAFSGLWWLVASRTNRVKDA